MRAGQDSSLRKDVSAQSDTALAQEKPLKPRACDQPAGQNQREIEEKLKTDKANADSSRAVPREPPNSEEKQGPEQGLVTVQDGQGGAAIDGYNQQSGTE
jgi:hypothetical protein